MGLLKLIITKLVLNSLILVFSCMFMFLYLIRLVKDSFSAYKNDREIKDEEPSILTDPTLGKHHTLTLKNCGNLEIHYVANGNKSKPLMLFLHGFPEFWYIWKFQLPEFGQDYYAVAIDMPGYGKSGKPTDVHKYTSEELARNVKEVVMELGYKSCILVGHDWGGAIAYDVAKDYPEVVDKLIVMNCPHGSALRKEWMTNKKQLLASSYMFFFQLPYLPEYVLSLNNCRMLGFLRKGEGAVKNLKNLTVEDLDAYKYTFKKSGFTGPLNYYRNIFTNKGKSSKELLKMPFLLVWGTKDKALRVEAAAASVKYFTNGRLKYIDTAGHWVNIDEPQEVNSIMKDFLDETNE